MSSFTNLLIVVVMIQFVMLIFGVQNVPGTSLYTFIASPSDWETAGWNLLIGDIIAAASLSVIIIGTFFIKNDFLIMAGIVGVIYSFGKPLISLWTEISAHSSSILATLIVGPIIILYIMLLLGFWRGRNT